MWTWMWIAAAAEGHVWANTFRELDLDNTVGDLHVEAGGDRIEIELVKIKDASCDIFVGDEAGRAVVRIRDRNRGGSGCQVNVAVRLPLGSTAELSLGAGDLHAVGVEGQIQAEIGAGDVRFEGGAGWALSVGAGNITGELQGHARLQIGAGNVRLSGLSAPIQAQVGTGTIDLGFDRAPVGSIIASTGVGNVSVDLPDGTPVSLRGTRSQNVALPISGDAPTVVVASSGLGRVSAD